MAGGVAQDQLPAPGGDLYYIVHIDSLYFNTYMIAHTVYAKNIAVCLSCAIL